MCEQCESSTQTSIKPIKKFFRKKIWALKPHYHCAIIGTCLSINELKKIIRQSGYRHDNSISDYDLHSIVVNQADTKNITSSNLQKILDKKYARFIKMISKCSNTQKLENYWRDALKKGDMAGLFWALMTHSHTSNELTQRVYGDIHMLSHIQGASNRVDIQRMQTFEQEIKHLRNTLSKTRQQSLEQISQRDRTIRKMQYDCIQLNIQLAEIKKNTLIAFQKNSIDNPGSELKVCLDWTEKKLAKRDIQLSEINEQLKETKRLLEEKQTENHALETSLQHILTKSETGDSVEMLNLQGKKILYLGGRSKLTAHMRSLVSNFNGEFAHHDGGIEQSKANLQCALASADMVFCPINCISHDACLRAKHHCQQMDKKFITLRSPGISTFSAALQKATTGSSELPAS